SAASVVPTCAPVGQTTLVLLAQSVPSATLLPCIDALPAGWHPTGSSIADGSARFSLGNDIAGFDAVVVELTPDCDVSGAIEIVPAPDEAGATVYQQPTSIDPFRSRRFVRFEGGCVTYTYTFQAGAPAQLSLEADEALSFFPREEVVAHVRRELNRSVCGAAAPPCLG
ncbi:MAG: hypothetical protein ACRELC_10680, partial [Gemmatimonadota bacterium]